jgi:hypothetical protein
VPAVALDNPTEVVPPEQIDWKDGVATTTGVGFTVTGTRMGIPLHPFADGVTVYVTVAGSGVRLTSAWAMLFPLPATAPDMLPGGAMVIVQEKVVPAVALDSPTAVVPPEQIV